MAELVVGSFAFDMTAWDLSDIAGGTVTSDTSGEVDVTGAGGHLVYAITGSGFTTFDTNGFPTDGTVTGVTMAVPGKLPMTITGISIAATDFMGFVNANDPTGLETAIFSGDDVFGGKAGNDVLYGYGGNDSFNLTKGGNDTANGGDGNDTFTFGAALTAGDSVDGGAGTDKIALNGDYSAGVTFGASTMINVESMTLVGAHDYDLVFNATSDTAGQSLNVTAANVTGSTHFVTLDGSALAGSLRLIGTSGNDTLKGGAGANTLNGGDGNDTIYGGTGDNHINGGAGGNGNTIIMSNWTAGESIANGLLQFDGDFSSGVTIAGSQLNAIITLSVLAGHDYNVTLSGAGSTIVDVDASTLGAANGLTLTVDAAPSLMVITGGAGDDVITVNNGINSIIALGLGGDDTVTGSTAADTINFNNTLTAADTVNGGGGNDLLALSGSYTLTLGADTIKNIHQITFANGSSTQTDSLVTNDANVAAGQTMDVSFNASQDTAVNFFDGSAETDGNFVVSARSVALSNFTGGAGDDTFAVALFSQSTTLNSGDTFDGGAGNDTLDISAAEGESATLGSHMLTSIETLEIQGAAVTTVDANVAAGQTLDVTMQGGKFNGTRETDGTFHITGDASSVRGGAGDDTIALSSQAGSGVTIHFTGGGGADTMSFDSIQGAHAEYAYNAVSDSTGVNYDSIADFGGRDFFQLTFAVTGVDASVTTGALSTASFDSDLAAAIGAGQLAASHAVIFTPDSGTLAGEHFLIVDANGVAGYQAEQDLVIEIGNTTVVTTSSFVT
jgi:Ca2+-binding RTX toxin-like protein